MIEKFEEGEHLLARSEAALEMRDGLKTLTDQVSDALCALARWDALHYSGHFIDVHPDMKARIDEVHLETQRLLAAFGLKTCAKRYDPLTSLPV